MKVQDQPLSRGSMQADSSLALVPGIGLLKGAWEVARQHRADVWAFAVELHRLTEAGSTVADLRWLESRGFIKHAVETTRPHQKERSFRANHPGKLARRTCLVLTPAGAEAAGSRLLGQPDRRPRPYWDTEHRPLW